jgi:hypothetical protein
MKGVIYAVNEAVSGRQESLPDNTKNQGKSNRGTSKKRQNEPTAKTNRRTPEK